MNNEKAPINNPEHKINDRKLEKTGEQLQDELNEKHEKSVENRPERAIDEAREKIRVAHEQHEVDKPSHEKAPKTVQPEHRVGRTKREKDQAFISTMDEARRHMSPTSRSFSKFIHHPVVEKTSDIIGSTIARPNAIAAGAVCAFLFTLVIYLIAHNNGYPLSGTESIAAFIAGWLFGQLFDYFKTLVTGKR